MPPKSFKADGTPKQRWSSADRSARGHAPRRRGGQPRGRAADATGPAGYRDAKSAPRAATSAPEERPAKVRHTRPDRAEWPGREARTHSSRSYSRTASEDRPRNAKFVRADKPTRTERTERSFTSDRPTRDRPDRGGKPAGTERATRGARGDKPTRYDRPARDDRPRSELSDRPTRGDRPWTDRPPRANRPVRVRPARDDFAPAPESRWESAVADTAETSSTDTASPSPTNADFASLGVPKSLVEQLRRSDITLPFPIQSATIPDALAGRDVLGRGQTGSGKTLAFGLPMIATLAGAAGSQPRGLVLVPTRELAMQVTDVLTPLARTVDLSVILVAGGMSYTPQLRAFQRGVDIVVATPGRLIDLMEQGAVDLSRTEIVVLDEADHMADLGFMPAVTEILDAVPSGGQRLLFSATLDGAVDRLVKQYLDDPVTHQVSSGQASVTTMAHHLINIAPKDKTRLTAEIAARPGRSLIFVRTQRGADRVAEQLREAGVTAGALHGGLTQGARTRILAVFKEGIVPVLVATDVAARGIHVDDIGLVLQVDPPAGPKEYLHRSGRTARAGDVGSVVTLVLPHQRREVSRLMAQAGVRGTELSALSGDVRLAEVTGARSADRSPISESEYQRLIAPPPSRRGPGAKRPGGKSGFHRSRPDDSYRSPRGPRRNTGR